MARQLRSFRQQGWHHVMNRGGGRRDIFLTDRDRIDFGQLLGESAQRHGVEVHAYCLMPNHFHLLVRCPDGGLSPAMQYLSSRYTRRFNDRHATDGPLMRGRFLSKEVDSDEYLVAAFRYVHLNPAPLLGDMAVERYRWSSLRTYLGCRRAPEWLHTGQFLSWLGGATGVGALVAGGHRAGAETLESLARFALDEAGIEGAGSARTAMLLLADRMPDLAAEIEASLEHRDVRLLGRARKRARSRAESDPRLRSAIDSICRSVA